ncbi:MAG: lipoate--protein ligase family protein [Candidatus Kariarchaeaceae archaeon]
MKLRLLHTLNHGVYRNLALEHAILQQSIHDNGNPTIRIWRNDKSIIMGRGQDINSEVDIEFCNENDIQIARRISGGGTVYQDLGNLNVSFFLSPKIKRRMNITDLKSMSKLMSDILFKSLINFGYSDLEIEGDSNILYQKKKISGSAGYMLNGWNLHHLTLLSSVNLDLLNRSILARERNPTDRKKSRYFNTTNLPNFDENKWIDQFKSILRTDIKLELYNDKVANLF